MHSQTIMLSHGFDPPRRALAHENIQAPGGAAPKLSFGDAASIRVPSGVAHTVGMQNGDPENLALTTRKALLPGRWMTFAIVCVASASGSDPILGVQIVGDYG
jgi:hypothetical protein